MDSDPTWGMSAENPVPLFSGFQAVSQMQQLAQILERNEVAANIKTEDLYCIFCAIDAYDFGASVTKLVAGEMLRRLASLDLEESRRLFSITEHGFSKKELERIEVERAWFPHASISCANAPEGGAAAAAAGEAK
jgi:hypothetical protein